MASLAHHLYTMACHNAWANHRLISACSQQSQEEFDAIAEDRDKTLDLTPDRNSCDPQSFSEESRGAESRASKPGQQPPDIDSRGRNVPV